MAESPVVTRFAPSPTGHLHIGGARTALFCWAFAQGVRRRGGEGRFLLRVEDTDRARSSEASTRGILADLAWLGIHWDEGPEFRPAVRGPQAHTTGPEAHTTVGGDPRGVGPFFQAQRVDKYDRYVMWLVERGLAYPAFETPEELEAKRRAATAKKQTYRYDRAALEIPEGERIGRMREADAAGTPYVVRFRMPDEPVVVVDEVLGDVSYAAGEVDDFVIRKADGFPTYHFAVVVDDELMGVTHVLRGQEHLNNTPKHVALQRALGFRTPLYAHMPLIFNMDGSKMSKRDKDKAVREAAKRAGASELPHELARPQTEGTSAVTNDDFVRWLGDTQRQLPADALEPLARYLRVTLPEIEVEDFRRAGYLPEVLCNFLALLGWSPGGDVEKFDMEFLAERFDLARIGKTNAKFDRMKLLSFNTDAMTAMSDEEFRRRWREWCGDYAPEFTTGLSDGQFTLLAAAVRPRCKTFRDAADQGRFVLASDDAVEFDEKAVEKVLRKGEPSGFDMLSEVKGVLAGLGSFAPADVHRAVEDFAAAKGLNMGKVAQPLRVALTGGTVSPPIDATVAVLGRERTIARIDRCLGRFA